MAVGYLVPISARADLHCAHAPDCPRTQLPEDDTTVFKRTHVFKMLIFSLNIFYSVLFMLGYAGFFLNNEYVSFYSICTRRYSWVNLWPWLCRCGAHHLRTLSCCETVQIL